MPVLNDHLEEQAALYASGALTALERQQFELILHFHEDLREIVKDFEETAVEATLETQTNALQPSPDLKSRILGRLDDCVQQVQEDGYVMTGPDGLVRWVNTAFSILCGYTLDEVKGHKLGPILQGPLTDPAAATRLREAVAAHHACTETLINYHKDGRPYWVELHLTPIRGHDGQVHWMVAREKEITDRAIPAA